jgi:hypothetical protein
MLRYSLCPRWHGMGFYFNKCSDTFCVHPGMGLVNTCWNIFCVLAGMGWIWTKLLEMLFCLACDRFVQHMLRFFLCPRCNGRDLFNTCCDAFSVFGVMGWFLSTHVEMHLVSSLAWDVFGLHMLRCIWHPSWQGRVLANPC